MADEPPPPPPGPPPGLDRAPAQPSADYPNTAAHASHDAYAQAYSAYYASAGYPAAPQPSGAAAPPAGGTAAPPPPPPPGQAGAAPPPAGGYDYSQYYQQYPYGYDYSQYYAQQGYSGYVPPPGHGHAAAPPPPPGQAAGPPPAAAPPARPSGGGRRMVTLQRNQQQAQQGAAAPPAAAGPGSYNAVPPPVAISSGGRRGGAGSMRQVQHQHAYARPAAPSLVSVAQATAAALSSGQAPAPRPAYTAVGAYQPKAKAQALNPAEWPPAVTSYVQRAFKAAAPSQRSKLQDVLKIVINDAQDKGELFTRGWDALPLPDLTQSAGDAAAIILEIAAVSSGAGAGGAAAAAAPAWRGASLQRRQQQQQYMDTQFQSQKHQQQNKQRGGKSAVGMVRENSKYSEGSSGRGGKSQRGRKRGRWEDPWAVDDGDLSGSDDDATQGGPLAADEEARRRRRQGRFGDGAADGAAPKTSGHGHKKPSAAQRRAALAALIDSDPTAGDNIDWDSFAIKGTCENLEKSYFRLTSAPDPATVRPEPVIRTALNRLIGLIASGEVNYFYATDQFKALRQDCVVQALKGPLAMAVYEAHARAALEYGDMSEYNQCQGKLKDLIDAGVRSEGRCENEFLAARILYQTVHAKHGEALALLNTLKEVGPAEKEAPEVSHALNVRAAMAAGDAARFFELYATAPRLGRALMDLAVTRVRFEALTACVKAFKPSLPVTFLARLLGFVQSGNDGSGAAAAEEKRTQLLPGCAVLVFEGANAAQSAEEGLAACAAWLVECGAVVTGEGTDAAVDCKASAGQLQMPPEKEKVAHGDANLDIGDFLKGFGDGE